MRRMIGMKKRDQLRTLLEEELALIKEWIDAGALEE
jgi:hypothetical protein